MNEARPQARRLQRPSWRDPRLLIGVVIVLASTVLGSVLFSRADDTVPVYAAGRILTPGDPIAAGDVIVVRARLGEGAADYLPASAPLPADRYALREVRPGELLPATAIGTAAQAGRQVVGVQATSASASTVTAGMLVDVYVNKPVAGKAGGTTSYAGPTRLLDAVPVASLPDTGAMLGGTRDTRTVHLLVPTEAVKGLVADSDAGALITLVPVPGSGS